MFTESDDMFAADFDASISGKKTNAYCFSTIGDCMNIVQRHSCLFFFCVCVPQSARLRAVGVGKDFKENPNLRDNWTDAEGYYRKCCSLFKD